MLLYRTWATLFLLVTFLAVVFRSRREDQTLAAEFGEQWDAYCREVPAWIPRLRRHSR
jgi:protein-S-isoprenylcysteine O-methyltransferase Ste14